MGGGLKILGLSTSELSGLLTENLRADYGWLRIFLHFSDRRMLRKIEVETEMQRTLVLRLSQVVHDMYLVTREEEVADLKRTDIRLLAIRGGQKAAIEVKIADAWTVSELRKALMDQLVG